jgi:hypothetical protein
MVHAAAFTVMVRSCVKLAPRLSTIRTLKDSVSAVVGVPVMIPVEEPRASPSGKIPDDKVQVSGAVPEEEREYEYADPTVPLGSVVAADPAPLTLIAKISESVAPSLSVTWITK